MPTTSEAHILVTLPNAKLTSSPNGTLAGRLALEYVTFDIPRAAAAVATATATRDVLLILRLGDGTFEEPLDPARTLTTSVLPSGARRYVFHATRDDPEFALELPLTPETADDVELFHSVLAGYATDFRGDVAVAAHRGALPAPRAYQNASGSAADEGVVLKEDLRGRFALMNEDSGEIVGALDGSVRVHEDASLGEKGHEADPVVVELPEGADTLDDVEVLVRTVPPEDRDWMVRGAVFARHVSPSPPLTSCAKPDLTH
jgi:spartin